MTDSPHLPDGMTVKPMYFSSGDWDTLHAPPFFALVAYAIGELEIVARFKTDTGHDLNQLTGRSPIERMVDTACGLDKSMMAAFCDWVATNMWGVEE